MSDQKKGQLTIEFMISLLVYLSIIFLLLKSISEIKIPPNLEDKMKAMRIAIIEGEKCTNNMRTYIETDCIIARPYVVCDKWTSRIYCRSDEYERT